MNEVLRDVLLIGGGLIGGLIFLYIKNKVFKLAKAELAEKVPFDIEKFIKGVFGLGNTKQEWSKTIAQELSLRTWGIRLAIIMVIIGVIYGYGWYKGHQGLQPVLDWHGKEEWVSLNDHYLHVKTDGSMEIVASDKQTVLKKLTVKDFENLKKNSRPYGLILEPVGVAGGGISNIKSDFEGGLGLRYAKFFKWVADVSLTNRGFYPFGISYKLTDSSAVGLSIGTGFKEGERGFFERYLIKYSFKF